MSLDAIIAFYDLTFFDSDLQFNFVAAENIEDLKTRILTEGNKRGFVFTREELDDTFDEFGLRDRCPNVRFPTPWIRQIVNSGWVPKGYSP